MKKTYKTNNGENRSSFFLVGRKLVTVRFLPTFTTENPMVQDAIEKSAAFREGIQLVTPSMEWIKIDRDENGFATGEFMDKLQDYFKKRIPVLFAYNSVITDYEVLSPNSYTIVNFLVTIKNDKMYTHYLPIPKLEV